MERHRQPLRLAIAAESWLVDRWRRNIHRRWRLSSDRTGRHDLRRPFSRRESQDQGVLHRSPSRQRRRRGWRRRRRARPLQRRRVRVRPTDQRRELTGERFLRQTVDGRRFAERQRLLQLDRIPEQQRDLGDRLPALRREPESARTGAEAERHDRSVRRTVLADRDRTERRGLRDLAGVRVRPQPLRRSGGERRAALERLRRHVRTSGQPGLASGQLRRRRAGVPALLRFDGPEHRSGLFARPESRPGLCGVGRVVRLSVRAPSTQYDLRGHGAEQHSGDGDASHAGRQAPRCEERKRLRLVLGGSAERRDVLSDRCHRLPDPGRLRELRRAAPVLCERSERPHAAGLERHAVDHLHRAAHGDVLLRRRIDLFVHRNVRVLHRAGSTRGARLAGA